MYPLVCKKIYSLLIPILFEFRFAVAFACWNSSLFLVQQVLQINLPEQNDTYNLYWFDFIKFHSLHPL